MLLVVVVVVFVAVAVVVVGLVVAVAVGGAVAFVAVAVVADAVVRILAAVVFSMLSKTWRPIHPMLKTVQTRSLEALRRKLLLPLDPSMESGSWCENIETALRRVC